MNNYSDLIEIAKKEHEKTGGDVGAIIKEILHYDILHALSQSNISQNLVFQGGTALRLCHGNDRYSEDLDFVCGDDSVFTRMEHFKEIFLNTIGEKYGLESAVKDPNKIGYKDDEVGVLCWNAKVRIPVENKAQSPIQKIKIEIVNAPSYQNSIKEIAQNYEGLDTDGIKIPVVTASLNEIMADKIIAFACRKKMMTRDIWDLRWMMNKGIQPDLDLVQKRITDYDANDVFLELMGNGLNNLISNEFRQRFEDEMSRFLVRGVRDKVFANNGLIANKIVSTVANKLDNVYDSLKHGKAIKLDTSDYTF